MLWGDTRRIFSVHVTLKHHKHPPFVLLHAQCPGEPCRLFQQWPSPPDHVGVGGRLAWEHALGRRSSSFVVFWTPWNQTEHQTKSTVRFSRVHHCSVINGSWWSNHQLYCLPMASAQMKCIPLSSLLFWFLRGLFIQETKGYVNAYVLLNKKKVYIKKSFE